MPEKTGLRGRNLQSLLFCMKYYDVGTLYITEFALKICPVGETSMQTEIKELNRLICNQCEEKEYEKCQGCRIYRLVNKIAAQ